MSRVVVVGSFVVDLVCRTPHLPSPGETVFAGPFSMGAGGKGLNQAVATALAGADTAFVGKVGKDDFASLVYGALGRAGILQNSRVFCDDETPTGTALIMVEEGSAENIITVAPGAAATLTKEQVREALSGYRLRRGDILLTQMETNDAVVDEVISHARTTGAKVILNPAPAGPPGFLAGNRISGVDFLTPNESEMCALTGVEVRTVDDVLRAATILGDRGFGGTLVTTMGGQGAVVVSPSARVHVPAWPARAVDTTGAGDAFNGAFAAALAEGKDIVSAVSFAAAAAAISVTRPGTSASVATRDEIETFIASHSTPEPRNLS